VATFGHTAMKIIITKAKFKDFCSKADGKAKDKGHAQLSLRHLVAKATSLRTPYTDTRLMAILQDNPGRLVPECLLVWIKKLRIIEVAVTTGATRRANHQSNCHDQQTNSQHFTGQTLLSPNQQHQSAEGKSHSMDLLTLSSLGGLLTLSLTT